MSDLPAIPNETSELREASDSAALLPVWHKPEISRISIASSGGSRPKVKPAGSTDDFNS